MMGENEITFGGEPVNLRLISEDVLIGCKGLVGKYSQLKAWREKSDPIGVYYFGAFADRRRVVRDISGGMKIDCLVGSMDEIGRIETACEKLITQPKT